MEIEQVRAAKREMEADIWNAVEKSIATFREKTGISPSGIDIRFIATQTIGEREPHLMVGAVHADVHL